MAAKYGKQNRRKSRRAIKALESSYEEPEQYRPPDRNECNEKSWTEYSDDSLLIRIWVWYYNGKLVDFYMSLHEDSPNYPDGLGPIIVSADCRNHGTFHVHNELNNKRKRKDILPLKDEKDVDEAYTVARFYLTSHAASIRERREE